MKAFLIFFLLILPISSFAEIYKWVDKNGRVHYGDARSKPKDIDAETLDIKINSFENVTIQSTNKITDKVVMYSTSWCGYCKQARKYFVANNIPFVEYDIEKNRKANQDFQKLGAKGVPVILYQKQRMNGFSVNRFKQFYDG